MASYRKPDKTMRVSVPGGTGRRLLLRRRAMRFCSACMAAPAAPATTCATATASLPTMAIASWFSTNSAAAAPTSPKTNLCGTFRALSRKSKLYAARLSLGRVHLLGQSWGTWLGTEYCLAHLDNVKTYIIANGSGSVPQTVAELNRLTGRSRRRNGRHDASPRG